MTTLAQNESDKPARGIWHTILRCKYCGERFGTEGAILIHKPAPAPKRSRQRKAGKPGKRSFCASERTMFRNGAWRGYAGVWWTVETGENDPTETFDIDDPQGAESNLFISDRSAYSNSAIPEFRKRYNGGVYSASVSKLRGALS